MKIVCLTAVLIVVTASVRSQSILIKPELLAEPITGIYTIQPVYQPRAKLIGKSEWGRIYALPQDNMPCLVPYIENFGWMPVYNPPVESLFIPNSYFNQNMVRFNKSSLLENNLSKKPALDMYNKSRNKPKF